MRRRSIAHTYMLLLIGACVLTAVLSVVIYAYTLTPEGIAVQLNFVQVPGSHKLLHIAPIV